MLFLLFFTKYRKFVLIVLLVMLFVSTILYVGLLSYINSTFDVNHDPISRKLFKDRSEINMKLLLENRSIFDIELVEIKFKIYDDFNERIENNLIFYGISDGNSDIDTVTIEIDQQKHINLILSVIGNKNQCKNITGFIILHFRFKFLTLPYKIPINEN